MARDCVSRKPSLRLGNNVVPKTFGRTMSAPGEPNPAIGTIPSSDRATGAQRRAKTWPQFDFPLVGNRDRPSVQDR